MIFLFYTNPQKKNMLGVQTQGKLRPEYKAAIDVNEKAIYNDSSG